MTPDMKRLCNAAEDAVDQAIIDAGFGRNHSVEAIVRAVLTELREPTDEMVLVSTPVSGDWPWGEPKQKRIMRAMIDHILAEPATAQGGENDSRDRD